MYHMTVSAIKVDGIRGVHTRPEPDPTRKSGSFGLTCDYVGSGRVRVQTFNFRVEIGFKVIVFKFSVGNKLCNKLSECWYLY